VPLKLQRLKQWCEDINKLQKEVKYNWLYIQQGKYEKYKPSSFGYLMNLFKGEGR